jgi:hypothetical protein
MKVQARHEFENITDITVNRPRKAGEIFEVDEKRAKLLLDHHLIEILPQEEPKVEEIKEEIKEEVKKPRKSKKK